MNPVELEVIGAPAKEPVAFARHAPRRERRLMAKFARLPGSLKPFKHAQASFRAFIDTLAKAGPLPIDQRLAIDAFALAHPYISRGHGGRHRPSQPSILSRRSEDRSRYSPAQEKRPFKRAADTTVQVLCQYVGKIAAKTKYDARAV